MVCVHFSENLSGYTPMIAGLAAPTFLLLNGMSYRLWIQSRDAARDPQTRTTKVGIRRGLFLFGLGFLFNVFVWMPNDTFNWDVLTLIGTALLVLTLVRDLSATAILASCITVIAITPVAQKLAGWSQFWTVGYFDPDMTFADVALGFLVTGYFPVLPWIIFPLIGYLVGVHVFSGTDELRSNQRIWHVAGAGIALLAVSAVLLSLPHAIESEIAMKSVLRWAMYPPTTAYLLGTLGLTLTSFSLLHRWMDRPEFHTRWSTWLDVAAAMSRHSLTIYLVHHMVHIWPLWTYSVRQGHEPTAYWQLAVSVPTAWCLAVLFLAMTALLFRWLNPSRTWGIESFMRWICD